MFPNMSAIQSSKGFALPAAIFVLVVVAGMVASMARLAGTQTSTMTMGLKSVQAEWAAQSGLEWGVEAAIGALSCGSVSGASFTINSFTVATACSETTHDEGPDTQHIFTVTATVSSTGLSVDDTDYVYKQLGAVVKQAGP